MKRIIIGIALALVSLPSLAATCKISEYGFITSDTNGRDVPVASEPAVTTQNITYTTSTASSAFNTATRFVRIVCDAKAHFVFGTSPTATAASPYVSADTPEYFAVPPNGAYSVAFYDGSS